MSELAKPSGQGSADIAVALRYEEGDAAPIVTASGHGHVARTIIDIAQAEGIAIDENPILASALEQAPLGEPIPVELYEAVAGVLRWVLSTEGSGAAKAAASAQRGSK